MSSDGEKEKSTEDMAKDACETDAAAATKEAPDSGTTVSPDGKQDADDNKDSNSVALAAAVDEEKPKDAEKPDEKNDEDMDEKKPDVEGSASSDTKKEKDEGKVEEKVEKKISEKSEDKEKNGMTTEKKEDDADDDEKNEEEGEEEDLKAPMPLGEIAKINDNITKTKVEGLQTLHTIVYDVPGKANVAKKNLRKFTGFNLTKASDEYRSKLEAIEKFEIKLLQGVCDILDLENTGSKEEVSARILEFLQCPEGEPEKVEEEEEDEDEMEEEEGEEAISSEEEKPKRKRAPERTAKSSGRPRRSTAGKSNRDLSAYVDYSSSDESARKVVPAKKRRKRGDSDSGSDYNPSGGGSDSDTGRKKVVAGRGRGRPAGRRGRRRHSESEEESASFDEDSDEPKRKRGRPAGRSQAARGRRGRKRQETESEEEDSEAESDISEEVKKKKSRTPVKANNKTRGTPANVSRARKVGRPRKGGSSEEENDKDESEDEPLSKRTKNGPPTDEEIKVYVKEILDEANLEEITMKTVCKQVYAKYPDFDLTDKKDFIKATVKSLIAA